MLEISIVIDPVLMDELEALFCEELQECWLLFQKDSTSDPLLKGYFDTEEMFIETFEALSEMVPALKGRNYEIDTLEDQDWKLAYRHHLKPWKYGHLNWIPEWERESYPVNEGDVYLYLDSGMAFGTGSHETTRLCMEAIYDFWKDHRDAVSSHAMIDAGCGSGILAMSAALLGYSDIYAFDRDPEAARVTQDNCEKNGLDNAILVRETGLEQGLQNREAEIFVANIEADVLMIYADNIVKAWKTDGILILSGILSHEREKVEDKFLDELKRTHAQLSFETAWDQKGDWVSILFWVK